MDCNKFSALLDELSAMDLESSLPTRMEDHANECRQCRQIFSLRKNFANLDKGREVPSDFSQNWRRMIHRGAISTMKPHNLSWRTVTTIAAAVIFMVGGTVITGEMLPQKTETSQNVSISAVSPVINGDDMVSRSMAAGSTLEITPSAVNYSKASDMDETVIPTKVIRTVELTLATRAFDMDMASIKMRLVEYGGRIEAVSISGDPTRGNSRYAYLMLRVPAVRLDDFIQEVQSIGRVTYSAENSLDVSDNYFDRASRLSTQETKMERLNALMETATELSDLIELESAIADTQYMIDGYRGELQGYDSKANDSTINITLYEESAKEASEAKTYTIGERILLGFHASWEAIRYFTSDLVVFLTIALPWIVVAAVITTITITIIRRKRK